MAEAHAEGSCLTLGIFLTQRLQRNRGFFSRRKFCSHAVISVLTQRRGGLLRQRGFFLREEGYFKRRLFLRGKEELGGELGKNF